MIRAIRRTRLTPLLIAVALLATMPASMLSLIHDDSDDPICGRAFVIHDHDAHHIGGTTPDRFPSLSTASSATRCRSSRFNRSLVSVPHPLSPGRSAHRL